YYYCSSFAGHKRLF
nr:immunoglobulin light chain junction region [Macaca mulatta]